MKIFFLCLNIPDGCTPDHLNLVARHGTHSPRKKRIRELDRLVVRIQEVLSGAKNAICL